MNYKEELQRATDLLASKGYIFIGQNMKFGGTSMYHMVKHLPEEQRIELPVFEETQMGMSIGMTLEGLKVCTTYPRMDFIILAINQIVNHMDKVKLMSNNQYNLGGLIVRVAIGSTKPIFSGEQHSGNYYEAIKSMCKDTNVVLLDNPEMIYEEYEKAINSDKPTILIEIADLYNLNILDDIKESKDK